MFRISPVDDSTVSSTYDITTIKTVGIKASLLFLDALVAGSNTIMYREMVAKRSFTVPCPKDLLIGHSVSILRTYKYLNIDTVTNEIHVIIFIMRVTLLLPTWFYSCRSRGTRGQLCASLYDKRGDFNFHIKNFPFLRSEVLRTCMAFLSHR